MCNHYSSALASSEAGEGDVCVLPLWKGFSSACASAGVGPRVRQLHTDDSSGT